MKDEKLQAIRERLAEGKGACYSSLTPWSPMAGADIAALLAEVDRLRPYEQRWQASTEEYTRDRAEMRDVLRAAIAECDAAHANIAERSLVGCRIAEALGAKSGENLVDVARRVVAERDAAVKARDEALRLHSVLHDCAAADSGPPHMHTLLRDEHSCAVDAINRWRDMVVSAEEPAGYGS